jgi:hypothetical protein
VCCGGQLGNVFGCPLPTTETPTGFGASGANNKCLWFFFFYCYRRQGPIPQNQYVINYNTRHPPALLTVYFLTPRSPPPQMIPRAAPWCHRSPIIVFRLFMTLNTHTDTEKEREHLLLPFETVGWNGISLVSFQPLSPSTSLSLSLSPLGF